jgi:hypothetical protein
MALKPDAVKGAFFAAVRAALSVVAPRIDFLALYRARVVATSTRNGLTTVDVECEDDRLSTFSHLPLWHGDPGIETDLDGADIKPGTAVMVGFADGSPAKPYVALWPGGEITIRYTIRSAKVQLVADTVELGGENLNPITDGLVHGSGLDLFSGKPYWQLGNASKVVRAKR